MRLLQTYANYIGCLLDINIRPHIMVIANAERKYKLEIDIERATVLNTSIAGNPYGLGVVWQFIGELCFRLSIYFPPAIY